MKDGHIRIVVVAIENGLKFRNEDGILKNE